MARRALISVVFIVALAVAAIVGTLVSGNEPLLGLDLQGGVSVVLEPSEDVDDDALDEAINIIRRRVDSLGVAEPEITRQGQTILVQMPGIDDPERAIELVGQTAELRFRPVLAFEPNPLYVDLPEGIDLPDPANDFDVPTTLGPEELDATAETTPPGAADSGEAPPEPEATVPAGEETGLGLSEGESAAAARPLQDETPTTTTPTDATENTGDETASDSDYDPTRSLYDQELTTPENDTPERTVVLAQFDDEGEEIARYALGPTALTGDALQGARATLQVTEWVVIPNFKSGRPGIDDLNDVAALCFSATPECPSSQLAIVLDGQVVSAPQIQQPSYEASAIVISGSFSEGEAKDLALVLKFGALPVELEPQAAQVVSATIGEDALRAGVIAGIIGLGLASLYMISYYRILGMVAVASLLISASMLWAIIAWLGETQGLALTLAGVTGIIVSIGVSLDSNVVYFEHLKEDIRNGRTLRSSVERSFATAFSTIVKADVASLIGAIILYMLTIGPVRGFALYVGLATVLDLIATYFFMRPAVILLGRWKRARERPSLLGLPMSGATEEPQSPITTGAVA
jgi:preprotein translocase subunit SecD